MSIDNNNSRKNNNSDETSTHPSVSSPTIFVAQTSKAYCWKKLADVFQNNLKTVSFEISPMGIRLQRLDSNQRILICMYLEAKFFDFFKCSTDPFSIGLSPEHFHSMLKGVKKKDSIEFRIYQDKPEDFVIMIRSSDPNMGRTTTSRLHTFHTNDIYMDTPEKEYGHPVNVSSSEYSKMCKDLLFISKTVRITAKEYNVTFACDAAGVYDRNVTFGRRDEDMLIYNGKETKKKYCQDFDTEFLQRVAKVSGLADNIQIYTKENYPLLLVTSVSTLGTISVYIYPPPASSFTEDDKRNGIIMANSKRLLANSPNTLIGNNNDAQQIVEENPVNNSNILFSSSLQQHSVNHSEKYISKKLAKKHL